MTCAFRHVAPFDDADFCGDDDYVFWFAPTWVSGVGNKNPEGMIECITGDRCAFVAALACDTSAFPEPCTVAVERGYFFQWWRPMPPCKGQGVQRFMFVCEEGP